MVLIIDIGCSWTKGYVFADDRQIWSYKTQTLRDADGIFAMVLRLYEYVDAEGFDIARVMVISYSDSVVYEEKYSGAWVHVPVNGGVGRAKKIPYERSGKPDDPSLIGIASQLFWLREESGVGLENIHRILPISTFIACQLAGNKGWNIWDLTHASNSGMFDFSAGHWLPEMAPFIEAGCIGEKITMPSERVPGDNTLDVRLGGHDTTFANANDCVYATKPYLSCGTWVTASYESDFEALEEGKGSRFLYAPNGAVLEQICFQPTSAQKGVAIKSLARKLFYYFNRGIGWSASVPPIKLFGSWASELEPVLKDSKIRFENMERMTEADPNQQDLKYPVSRETSYLHKQAAIYAGGAK